MQIKIFMFTFTCLVMCDVLETIRMMKLLDKVKLTVLEVWVQTNLLNRNLAAIARRGKENSTKRANANRLSGLVVWVGLQEGDNPVDPAV